MFIAETQNSLFFKQLLLLRNGLFSRAGSSLASADEKTITLKAVEKAIDFCFRKGRLAGSNGRPRIWPE